MDVTVKHITLRNNMGTVWHWKEYENNDESHQAVWYGFGGEEGVPELKKSLLSLYPNMEIQIDYEVL